MEVNFNFSNKRALAGIIVLICLVALVFYVPGILSHFEPATCTIDGVCQHEQYANFLTELAPVFVIVGIVIGALVFFFMSSRLENKQKDLSKVALILLKNLQNKEQKNY